VFVGRVSDDPGDLVARVAEGMAMTPEQGAATPHVLVGSVDHIVEELQRRREEYGFSYIAISGPAAEQFAPVVARLAGT